MSVHPPKGPKPLLAVTGQLFDIMSNPNDLIKVRIALRSWFTSYLTQTDDHVNHSPLEENIWFYEVLQEWLDSPLSATIDTPTTI